MYSNTPLISIMLVSENNEDCLEECLNSLFNQTYRNFEVIVRDNCSVDKTFDIALRFQKRFREKNIYFLVQENRRRMGYPNCLKLCGRECEGEFKMIINPQMVLDELCLEECARMFVDNKDVGVIVVDDKAATQEVEIFESNQFLERFGDFIELSPGLIMERYIVQVAAQSKNSDFEYHTHLSKLFSDASISKVACIKKGLIKKNIDYRDLPVDKWLPYLMEKYLLLLHIKQITRSVTDVNLHRMECRTNKRLYEICNTFAERAEQRKEMELAEKCRYLAKVFSEDEEN